MGEAWIMFREAGKYAQDCAADYDPSSGQDADDYAHECADGSAYVIYHGKALDLYSAAAEVRAYGDDVADYVEPDADIETRASVAVYLWLRDEITDAIRAFGSDDGGES